MVSRYKVVDLGGDASGDWGSDSTGKSIEGPHEAEVRDRKDITLKHFSWPFAVGRARVWWFWHAGWWPAKVVPS